MTIAELNDKLRATGEGGRILATRGVNTLEPEDKVRVWDAVRTFADFEQGNDPWGEHDFGKVSVGQMDVFFKIDYYADDSYTVGAESGLDCKRVMTVMLAEEY